MRPFIPTKGCLYRLIIIINRKYMPMSYISLGVFFDLRFLRAESQKAGFPSTGKAGHPSLAALNLGGRTPVCQGFDQLRRRLRPTTSRVLLLCVRCFFEQQSVRAWRNWQTRQI